MDQQSGGVRRAMPLKFKDVRASFDERGQLLERFFTTSFVFLAEDCDFGAFGAIGEADGHSHLACKCGVLRLELHDFDNLLVRNQFEKSAPESVGIFGRFASQGVLRVQVGKRLSECFTFAHGRHAPDLSCCSGQATKLQSLRERLITDLPSALRILETRVLAFLLDDSVILAQHLYEFEIAFFCTDPINVPQMMLDARIHPSIGLRGCLESHQTGSSCTILAKRE